MSTAIDNSNYIIRNGIERRYQNNPFKDIEIKPNNEVKLPLKEWNRLEGYPRNPNLQSHNNRPMKAEVRDPLWMLCRQWQWGEFQAEDSGSAVFAKVHKSTQYVSQTVLGEPPTDTLKTPESDYSLRPYSNEIPLEALVERVANQHQYFDPSIRLKAGKKWKEMMEQSVANGGLSVSYHAQFMALDGTGGSPDLRIQLESGSNGTDASWKARNKAWQLMAASSMAAHWIDGFQFYLEVKDSVNVVSNWFMLGSDVIKMFALVGDFVTWFEKNFGEIDGFTAWNNSRMEYAAGLTVGEAEGSSTTALMAKEYHHGRLDWHSFDILDQAQAPSQYGPLFTAPPAGTTPTETEEVITTFPSRLAYSGMPVERWWEIEDSTVNYGTMKPENADLSPIMVSQFGLMYSNDWSSIPLEVPTGSLTSINGVVITDSFGVRTWVEPAGKGANNNWHRWAMFNLSSQGAADADLADQRLFIPPVSPDILESKPLEELEFMRDEMANMVWAVEKIVPDWLGGGQDGHTTATKIHDYIASFVPGSDSDKLDNNLDPIDGVALRYNLQNSVPENWIPYIPVSTGASYRDTRFMRGRMPRIVPNMHNWNGLSSAEEKILKYALPQSPLIGDTDNRHYIYEEEVPKAGVRVITTVQRARWKNGKSATWVGRRKTAGRGGAQVNLQFDQIEPSK